jgi:PTS system galactitol-specific IIA component
MYFDQRLCFFHQKVESQDQLFQMMTDKMLEAGCVKENYYEGISNREKEYPTGLLVNQTGFAIPHTDSERVNKSQICFLSLDEPIEFEDMVDKSHKISVELVFMLAMAQPHEQVNTLQNLIALFQDDEKVAKLKECNTEKEREKEEEKEIDKEINNNCAESDCPQDAEEVIEMYHTYCPALTKAPEFEEIINCSDGKYKGLYEKLNNVIAINNPAVTTNEFKTVFINGNGQFKEAVTKGTKKKGYLCELEFLLESIANSRKKKATA